MVKICVTQQHVMWPSSSICPDKWDTNNAIMFHMSLFCGFDKHFSLKVFFAHKKWIFQLCSNPRSLLCFQSPWTHSSFSKGQLKPLEILKFVERLLAWRRLQTLAVLCADSYIMIPNTGRLWLCSPASRCKCGGPAMVYKTVAGDPERGHWDK